MAAACPFRYLMRPLRGPPPGTAVGDLPISWQPPFRRRPAAGAEGKRACAVGIHRRRRRRHPHARPSRPVPGPYIPDPFDVVRRGRAGPDLFFARRRTDRHLPVLYQGGTAASGARRGRRKRVRTGLDRRNGRVTCDDSKTSDMPKRAWRAGISVFVGMLVTGVHRRRASPGKSCLSDIGPSRAPASGEVPGNCECRYS